MRRIMILLDTPPGIPTIPVLVDVISANVPALMEMDVLDQHLLTPCTVTNRLVKRTIVVEGDNYYGMDDWYIPLTRFDGHLYA